MCVRENERGREQLARRVCHHSVQEHKKKREGERERERQRERHVNNLYSQIFINEIRAAEANDSVAGNNSHVYAHTRRGVSGGEGAS
jgi:uncharacterized protein Veg